MPRVCVCMVYMALITAMVLCANLKIHYRQCLYVGYISYSRLLDLRAKHVTFHKNLVDFKIFGDCNVSRIGHLALRT